MPRLIQSIELQRRFGGWIAVLRFTNGTEEATSSYVLPTPEHALTAATKWISRPEHNVKWWSEYLTPLALDLARGQTIMKKELARHLKDAAKLCDNPEYQVTVLDSK